MAQTSGTGPDPAHDRLQRVNTILRAIRNVNQLIVRERDVPSLIRGVCRLLVETRGYHSAWIALFDDDGDAIATAQAGLGAAFDPVLELLSRKQLPPCGGDTLARPGVHVFNEPATECSGCPLISGYRSRAALAVRLSHGSRVFGLLGLSVPPEFSHDEEELELVREVAGDLGFALHTVHEAKAGTAAAEALRREQDITSSLFDTSPVAIAVVEAGGGIVRANAEAERVLGLMRTDITRRTYDDPAWRIVGFDGKPFPVSELPVARVLREKRAVHGIEHVVQWPDGRRVLLSVNASPVSSAQGAITHVVCTMRDVTSERRMEAALRKSEHSLRALFDAMTSGFVLYETVCDAAGRPADFRFLEVNPAFQRITGLKAVDVIGRTLLSVLPPDEQGQVEKYRQVVMSGVGTTLEVHSRSLEKDLRLIVYCPEPGRLATLLEDVTIRKRAEVALRESEERYRALFEQSLDAIWLIAWDGPVMDVNRAFLRLFGYERADIASLTAQDLYEDPDERERTLQQILESGYVEGDVRLKRKDGTVLDCERHVVALRDRNGAIVALQGVARDISARKRAEAALRESEERYRSLFEHSLDAIWIGRPDGSGNVVNPAWLRMFGYTAEDMPSLNALDVYADPRERTGFLRHVTEAGTFTDEVRFKRKDGTEFLCERTVVGLRDSTGRVIRFQGIIRDITARKRAEEALRESEQKYRALFEQSGDAVSVVALDGRLLDANPAWLALFGCAREELPTLNISGFYAEPGGREDFLKRIAGVGWLKDEVRFRRRDGIVFLCDRSVTALKDASGTDIGFQETVRDITEARRAEHALRESEEKYRSLFEQSGEAISVVAPDGRVLDANQAWLTLFGCTRDELPGLNIIDFYAEPQDRDRFLRRITVTGQVKDEVSYRRRDGSVFVCERSAVAQKDSNDAIVGFQAMVRDVPDIRRAEQALRESEERFRGVFENGPVGIAIVDTATFRILRANRAYQEIVGYSEDELKQMSIGDITPTEDWSRQQQFMEARFEAGYSGYTIEKHYVRKSAEVRDVVVVGEWMRSAPDSPLLLIVSVLDISDRKRVEHELAESRENLRLLAQRVEQAREDERTAIARELHDRVGQTLTALKLDIDRLKRMVAGATPEASTLLDGMAAMVTDGEDDVRRISSELRPGALDDLGLAGAIEWQLDQLRPRTDIAFTLSWDGTDCSTDVARTTALFRVFQELVTNVVRHAGAKNVAVSLRSEDGLCVLVVTDDGRGIDAVKLNDPRSLGIAGIRERLLPYGGEVHFETAPGKGTTARVVMPLQ